MEKIDIRTVYGWSKKIHRFTMWLVIGLGIPQSISGAIMGNSTLGRWVNGLGWGEWTVWLHRQISTKFVVVLTIMMISGFLMWVIPKILAKSVVKEE
jgi:hypothetical protein